MIPLQSSDDRSAFGVTTRIIRRSYIRLLTEYNDGRKKTLFCLAVNLLSLEDLRTVFENTDLQLPVKDRAKLMEKRLKERSSIELKLRRK